MSNSPITFFIGEDTYTTTVFTRLSLKIVLRNSNFFSPEKIFFGKFRFNRQQYFHRNALSKVYISHSRERNLSPGDIILFYRTGGYYHSVVSTIGIVETVHNPVTSLDELERICYKKTFFDRDGLSRFWNRYGGIKPFVVEFLYAYSLPKRLNLATLIDLGVIADSQSAPRGFSELSWEQFVNVFKASKSDENIVVD